MRITYKTTESVLPIPYAAQDRGNDRPNIGYVVLKRQPELIDTIPELMDVPELKALVREMNHPRSIVRSLGCERATGLVNQGDPVINRGMNSFVRMCFEILEWNGAEQNYHTLYENFEQFCHRSGPHSEYITVTSNVISLFSRITVFVGIV